MEQKNAIKNKNNVPNGLRYSKIHVIVALQVNQKQIWLLVSASWWQVQLLKTVGSALLFPSCIKDSLLPVKKGGNGWHYAVPEYLRGSLFK